LRILYDYIQIIANPEKYRDLTPVTCIFAAKAAPGYNRAKTIIKLINDVADKINNDSRVMDKIKVVFLENYSVSLAQMIFPASDISQQISTASKEASGTGNMKFMMNGALTLGTMDGANVEIFESVGADNIYIFGYDANTVQQIYKTGQYDPMAYISEDYILKTALEMLTDGSLNSERLNLYKEIYESLVACRNGMSDQYLILGDFKSYKLAHDRMIRDYSDRHKWNRMAIINVANSGRFSSDISISNYNKQIWKLK
jgi:starch phosphorylase